MYDEISITELDRIAEKMIQDLVTDRFFQQYWLDSSIKHLQASSIEHQSLITKSPLQSVENLVSSTVKSLINDLIYLIQTSIETFLRSGKSKMQKSNSPSTDGEQLDQMKPEEWEDADPAYPPEWINVKKKDKVTVFVPQSIQVNMAPVIEKSELESTMNQASQNSASYSSTAPSSMSPPFRMLYWAIEASTTVDFIHVSVIKNKKFLHIRAPHIEKPLEFFVLDNGKVEKIDRCGNSVRKFADTTIEAGPKVKPKSANKRGFIERYVHDLVRRYMVSKNDTEVEVETKIMENDSLSIVIKNLEMLLTKRHIKSNPLQSRSASVQLLIASPSFSPKIQSYTKPANRKGYLLPPDLEYARNAFQMKSFASRRSRSVPHQSTNNTKYVNSIENRWNQILNGDETLRKSVIKNNDEQSAFRIACRVTKEVVDDLMREQEEYYRK